ncbi:MAG: polysaccharide deacetylase family protein, partial [Bacteroidales bacterium]|nr:polysaccharide deacetylase family protein [Bacteroidales bacterium]
MPSKGKVVYLTFDDGPTKEVTPLILDILALHKIKATFFVLGKNVLQNPEIFQRILDEGHAVGNHTFSHLKGWKTDNKAYFEDVK